MIKIILIISVIIMTFIYNILNKKLKDKELERFNERSIEENE